MIQRLPLSSPDHSAPQNKALPHVLLVVDQFPKALGGGEHTVLKLAELLPHYGYRVSILTFSIHPNSVVLTTALSCPTYLLPLSRTYDLTALRAAFVLRRFVKRQKIVLVQTFFESSDLWAGLVVKTLSRARLIWSRRDMGILRDRKHRIAYRLMAGIPDRVFAVSEQVRQHCIEVDRVDKALVKTIYNGIELATETPARLIRYKTKAQPEYVITTIGNIRHVKGHDILIKAAAIVLQRSRNVSFSIAGAILEREYFTTLQDLVRELRISDHFRFIGEIKDIRGHLHTADVFVLPSRSEGFSNAIIEAMAEALPVIATNVGGNAEAVLDGITGFIIPPDDPETMATSILKLIENKTLAMKMGDAGHQRVLERFTTVAMMNQTVAVYRQLLRSPKN